MTDYVTATLTSDATERTVRYALTDICDALTAWWVRAIWTTGDITDDSTIWAWLDWLYSLRGVL